MNGIVRLKKSLKIFSGNFAVFDDLGHKTFSDGFTAMDGYDGTSSIMVS